MRNARMTTRWQQANTFNPGDPGIPAENLMTYRSVRLTVEREGDGVVILNHYRGLDGKGHQAVCLSLTQDNARALIRALTQVLEINP